MNKVECISVLNLYRTEVDDFQRINLGMGIKDNQTKRNTERTKANLSYT